MGLEKFRMGLSPKRLDGRYDLGINTTLRVIFRRLEVKTVTKSDYLLIHMCHYDQQMTYFFHPSDTICTFRTISYRRVY